MFAKDFCHVYDPKTGRFFQILWGDDSETAAAMFYTEKEVPCLELWRDDQKEGLSDDQEEEQEQLDELVDQINLFIEGNERLINDLKTGSQALFNDLIQELGFIFLRNDDEERDVEKEKQIIDYYNLLNESLKIVEKSQKIEVFQDGKIIRHAKECYGVKPHYWGSDLQAAIYLDGKLSFDEIQITSLQVYGNKLCFRAIRFPFMDMPKDVDIIVEIPRNALSSFKGLFFIGWFY